MKKSSHSFGIAFALACGLAVSAAAGDKAVWTNVTDRTASWRTVGNWTDDQGAPLAAVPGNGEDVIIGALNPLPAHNAYVDDSKMVGLQRINYLWTNGEASNPQVGSVVGDERHTLAFDSEGTFQSNVYKASRSVTIGDPSQFLGFWLPGGMQTAFILPSAAVTPYSFGVLSSKQRPILNVADAAGSAEIGALHGGGAFEKSGAGSLRVKGVSGERTLAYVNAGELVLDGPAGDFEAILEKAALHLDASVSNSLVCACGEDGLVSVERWNDVRGGGYFANKYDIKNPAAHEIRNSNPPFLSESSVSPTGLPLVDFGARNVSEYPERGRTNCVLKIWRDGALARVAGVRAAFYAVSSPKGASSVQILGDSDTISYMCGENTRLFSSTYSDPAVRYGDIIVNNQKHAFDGFAAQTLTDLYTFGIGVTRDTAVGWLGTRQLYASTTGGSRMGEILLFTNDLTRAERMLVCRYLDAKWRTGTGTAEDLAAVSIAKAAKLGVPAGKRAVVGQITATGKVLNKTGDGKLVIGTLAPADTTINVSGGEVAFSGRAIDDTAVAPNPYMHLDATAIDPVKDAEDLEVVGDVTYVNRWKDATAGSGRAATSALEGTSRPTLITSPLTGCQVVDFGTRDSSGGTGAWMKMPNWSVNEHYAYSGFMVLRVKAASSSTPHFGSSAGMAMYRDSYAAIISPFYKNFVSGAMQWKVNGLIEEPFSSQALNATDEFRVLSFVSTVPVPVDAIVADKGGQSSVKDSGGLEVGEVVIYDRLLDEDELLSTEAHLMKKWLGKEIPGSGIPTPTLAFAADADMVIDSEVDLDVAAVSGGDGVLIKRGEGKVRLPSVTAEDISSVSVEGGTLALSLTDRSRDPLIGAAIADFDASKTSSLTLEDGTNVFVWADKASASRKATAVTDLAVTKRLPALVQAETAPGVTRPVIDFGEFCETDGSEDGVTDGIGAAMNVSPAPYIGEVFTVFSDAHGSRRCWTVGDSKDWVNQGSGHGFARGANGQFVSNDGADPFKGSSVVRNSFHYVDNMTKNLGWSGVIGSGFHVLRSSLTNGSSTWLTYESLLAIANGCNVKAGGAYFAEQMVFNRILTAEEATKVGDFLKWKWFGAAKPELSVTNVLPKISLAGGAILDLEFLNDDVEHEVRSLSGSGTINAGELKGVSSLAFACGEDGWDSLEVSGAVRFADAVTVTLSAPVRGFTSAGDHVLLSAGDLGDCDPSGWTVNVAGTGLSRFDVSIRRDGNSIVLCLRKHGAVLIVR